MGDELELQIFIPTCFQTQLLSLGTEGLYLPAWDRIANLVAMALDYFSEWIISTAPHRLWLGLHPKMASPDEGLETLGNLPKATRK